MTRYQATLEVVKEVVRVAVTWALAIGRRKNGPEGNERCHVVRVDAVKSGQLSVQR
jgi:hypothetical protein